MSGTKMYAELPVEVIKQLEALGNAVDDVVDDMLDAAVDEVMPEIKQKLKEAVRKGYETGELAGAMKVKKTNSKKRASDHGRFITFEGNSTRQKAANGKIYPRKKVVRNNEIAAVLEYGKSDQEPQPYMRPAFIAKNEAMVRAMEETFDRETKKYQG